MITPTTETAKEVLRGYGRANEAALASLMGSSQKTENKAR